MNEAAVLALYLSLIWLGTLAPLLVLIIGTRPGKARR